MANPAKGVPEAAIMQRENMPVLVVPNIFKKAIPGLGSRVALNRLSQKRVTVAVRKILRERFDHTHVEVSCSASFQNGVWTGRCRIDDKRYSYTVQ